MKNIATALVAAQKDFAPAIKTATNPHFRSKYVTLEGCIDAVLDALNSHGIFLHQATHHDENGICVETMFIHESGEQMSGGKLFVPAPKQDPQGFGSALSYARRYSLMSACGIAPEDDDGNSASKPVSAEQAANIAALAEEVGKPIKEILDYFKVKKVEQIPAAQYNGIIKTLEKKREESK